MPMMTTDGSSPYSTGGGGVWIEHRYAATLVAAVLAEDPISELGDDVVPHSVRLQASYISPIDDVVVEGRTRDGLVRRVSIGVRRNPKLATSDEKSVPLVRSFLQVVTGHWDEVVAGRWRVALAVGISSTAVQQTDALARIARSVSSAAAFRTAVARPGAVKEPVRDRLRHLDALVVAAAKDQGDLLQFEGEELTWRWLMALRVRQMRLEGVDESDRATAVSALRRIVADEATTVADDVFARLAERSGAWASSAADLDQMVVRRELSGFPLGRTPSYRQAWSTLDGMAGRLREGIRPDLRAGEVRLELDRTEERARLADLMDRAGRAGSGLVVTGEPDVGKSALTIRTAQQLTERGAAVACLSLRDLPESAVQVEHLLGGRPLTQVFAAGEIRAVRLLVIDGAEAVLEGRRDLLREVATAAFRAGLGVVAVTRSDGAARVREVVQWAAAQAERPEAVAQQVVSRLTFEERRQLVETFHTLIRFSADTRAEWLVGRPGLVDVLLRAGTVTETSTLLSEADVFVAVWNGLVRKGEEYPPGGVSPDDREQAVLAVARRALKLPGSPPAGVSLPQLRSDAVLRAPANPAFAAGDEFATDLMRDFALCRLFFTEGWEPLRKAGAPRWAMRAVRLACQVKLLAGQQAAAWRELRGEFGQLGEKEGERWTEVPMEALLTLGNAQTAIDSVWDDLAADDHRGLKTLLRLAGLRYVTSTVADPFTLAPVVALTYCTDRDLGQNDHYFRGMGESIRDLVLAWLRGMVRDTQGPDLLRRQVRDRVLAAHRQRYDDFAVEALATLGPDTDEASEQWLRETAAKAPNRLQAAVESFGAVFMARTHPRLLLELTEAYYIHQPERSRWGGGGRYDEGIRGHHRTGFGPPFAAWHFGPFHWLLHSLPGDALDMINRMLDHAAACRVRTPRQPGLDLDGSDTRLSGISLDIPGIGPRRFVGDSPVWGWYRGATVGPYPCMSALMAVERFADSLVADGIPYETVVRVLLRGCNNLAMAGLVVGLLVRHLEEIGDLLDVWLTSPAVWRLETSRTSTEGHFQRGPWPDDVAGADRRTTAPRDVAADLTQRAIAAGDQARLDALAEVADRLVAAARAEAGEDCDEQLTRFQGWASLLRSENYPAYRTNNTVVLQYTPPADVAEGFAPLAAQVAAGGEALRLQHTYGGHHHRPDGWQTDALLADLALARKLAADPPAFGPLNPQDAPAAVAAASVISHARGLAAIPDEDLRWAADVLLATPTTASVGNRHEEDWVSPMDASSSAARALPYLLLAPFDHLGIAQDRLEQTATALTALPDGIRTLFAASCAPVWESPCEEEADLDTPCRRHQPLWAAVQAGIGGCRLGPWRHGSRQPEFLPPPYTDTLPAVPVTDLLVNRLAMPIACAAAARSTACLAEQATALLPVLTDVHRNGAGHWMTEDYAGYDSPERELVVRAFITLAADGTAEPLTTHLRTFAANANALQQLLHDAATLFTYDAPLRALLPDVWPLVLTTTLDALDAGATLRTDNSRWAEYAIAALLPTPQLRTADPNPDDTLDRANRDWLPPSALGDAAERWIDRARGEAMAADALARFARTTPSAWQYTTGLPWLERVIGGRYAAAADHCWYVIRWLTELRETGIPDAADLSRWRRIVDGLAAAGDRSAVELQRIDE
ncbi:ATP-binding protein [Streptomyces hyaluromycini]|uniref:ATP-binding protein n=1 Tax=Streptomyces hyaluromycini TaxID=1377993 RepID=A0ABV1WQJ9_9ACTN